MLKSAIVRTVDTCTRHPWSVIILALVLTVGSAFYAARHFEITTDVEQLISKDLPWRRRQAEFYQAFPQRDIIAVVDAPVPELVARATDELSRSLMQRQEFIRGVRQPGSGEFFARNGLLFLSADDVNHAMTGMTRAEPLLATLVADPSLRGVTSVLESGLTGVEVGELKLDDLTRPMTLAGETLDQVLAGRSARFSWQGLTSGRRPEPSELRRFIEVARKELKREDATLVFGEAPL